MHVVTVQFQVHPEKANAFRTAVTEQAANSLGQESDCLQFDVAVEPDDSACFFLYELYRDAEAFQVHLESSHFKRFDETVKPWVVAKTVSTFERIWPTRD